MGSGGCTDSALHKLVWAGIRLKPRNLQALHVLGIIPARGGSKGVPRKNIKALVGKPLIAHSILAAQQAECLDRFIVSTDDEEIAEVARAYGAEVPFLRPKHLAQDDTPDLPVFQHALAWLWEQEGLRPDILVHLRPTYPLRTAQHICEVVQKMIETGADCVKSVRLAREHPHKMWELVDGRLVPYLKTEFRLRVGPDYPRQKLERVYISCGLVDAVRTEVVENGSTTGTFVVPYLFDPRLAVDLDYAQDFLVAETLMEPGVAEGSDENYRDR
jgi:CMP-N,N'-diacetyllegionaminic acid synthase